MKWLWVSRAGMTGRLLNRDSALVRGYLSDPPNERRAAID